MAKKRKGADEARKKPVVKEEPKSVAERLEDALCQKLVCILFPQVIISSCTLQVVSMLLCSGGKSTSEILGAAC